MYTVALDVALRKSGLVVLLDKKIVYKSTIVIPDKLKFTDSMMLLHEKFGDEFKHIKDEFGSDAEIVIEDVLGYVNIKAALAIHAARAVAVVAWGIHHPSHVDIAYLTPNDVKYFFTKKRTAKKDELQAAMRISHPEYDYTTLSEDEVDALGLAITHLEGEKNENTVRKPKRRRVSK